MGLDSHRGFTAPLPPGSQAACAQSNKLLGEQLGWQKDLMEAFLEASAR